MAVANPDCYLFSGGRLLDPRRDELVAGMEVLVEGERVTKARDKLSKLPFAL
jgi:hypothetical protein